MVSHGCSEEWDAVDLIAGSICFLLNSKQNTLETQTYNTSTEQQLAGTDHELKEAHGLNTQAK